MRIETQSEGWADLVDSLKQLEAFFPDLSADNDDFGDELSEEIEELRELIAAAGEPEDEHSLRALTFLQAELARKRALLDDLF